MRIRKIFKLICPVLALLLLTGCRSIKNIIFNAAESSANNSYKSPHEYAVATFNEINELVQKRDSQAIFDLFSEYNKKNFDIMPDI